MTWYNDAMRHQIISYGAFSTNSTNNYTKIIKQINSDLNQINKVLEERSRFNGGITYDKFTKKIHEMKSEILELLDKIEKEYLKSYPYLYNLCEMTHDRISNKLRLFNSYSNTKIDRHEILYELVEYFVLLDLIRKLYPEYKILTFDNYPIIQYPEFDIKAKKTMIIINPMTYKYGEKMRAIGEFDSESGLYKVGNNQNEVVFFYHLLKATRPDASRKELIKLTYDLINDINNSRYAEFEIGLKRCIAFDDKTKKYGIEAFCPKSNNNIHIKFTDKKTVERLKKDPIFKIKN